MDVHRIYIDTRGRVSGDPSEFEYRLSLEVVVAQESIAVLDTVLIPVSWYVVEKDVNDRIYVTEQNFSGLGQRIATIPPGHYDDVYAMAPGIEEALNTGPRLVISPYTITYDSTLGRFQVSNPWTGADEACYIVSKYSLLRFLNPSSWGSSANDLRGAFRQIGMLTGPTAFGVAKYWGRPPFTFNDAPSLHTHNQLFITGSLGIPGLVQGPGDQVQDILRRVAISAPQLALNFGLIDKSL